MQPVCTWWFAFARSNYGIILHAPDNSRDHKRQKERERERKDVGNLCRQPGDVDKTARSLYVDPLIPDRENPSAHTRACLTKATRIRLFVFTARRTGRELENGKKKKERKENGTAYEYAKLGLRKKRTRRFTEYLKSSIICDGKEII